MVSVDGVMQAPGGPEEDTSGDFKYGGWTVPHLDDVVGARMGETFSAPYDLLLGRKTYDIFSAYWPQVPLDPTASGYNAGTAAIARQFNRVTKYVATHHPQTLTWENSQPLGTNVVGTLRELKMDDGPMLLVQGSSALIHTLLAHDLVDELRLVVFPLVLGHGKRLFRDDALPAALKLAKSTVSPSGVVIATYERTGEVRTGSF
jgi:dihydrofolate reductase